MNPDESAPKNVIRLLDQFKKQYYLNRYDELWLVIDRDPQSFKKDQISEVAQLCIQKGYYFALSNPCFELWLLLHRPEFDEMTEEEKFNCFENKAEGKRRYLEKKLNELMGGFKKSAYDANHLLAFTEQAIERAKQLDSNPSERWCNGLGTRVYLLVEKIIKTSSR